MDDNFEERPFPQKHKFKKKASQKHFFKSINLRAEIMICFAQDTNIMSRLVFQSEYSTFLKIAQIHTPEMD